MLVLVSILVCVCIIAALAAGYFFALYRVTRDARVQPVATEVASSQVVATPHTPTPEPTHVDAPTSPTTPVASPKGSVKKSTSPKGGVASFTGDLPSKPNRKDFADAKAYKAAYDAWWRTCKRMTSGSVQPKVESKESKTETPVVVNNKPETTKPVSPKGKVEKPSTTCFTHTEGMPAKPNRADYVDGASYKKAYDAWWRQCKKMAKGVTNVTPKAETPQPKVENTETTAPKTSTKGAKENPTPVQPKVEEPVQTTTPEPTTTTPSKKADFLALISTKLNGPCKLVEAVRCTMGKAQRTITSVTIENGEVMFVVSDGINDAKSIAAKTVCFSKTTCAEVLNNLEKVDTKKPATAKPAPSKKEDKNPKGNPSKKDDVQPVDPQSAYRLNAIEAIVKTMNNKNVATLTFGEGIKTEILAKKGNAIALISHLDRGSDGRVMMHLKAEGHDYNLSLGNNNGCTMIPLSTYQTIHAALNAAIGKKKDAQAKVTYIKSVAC